MKDIQIDSFKDYRYVGNVTLSPRATYLAYTLTTVDYDKNRYRTHIYVMETASRKSFQLTNGQSGESSFQFLDDETILFQSDREASEQAEFEQQSHFYRISLRGGEAVLDLTIPLAVSKLIPISDDEFLVEGQYNPRLDGLSDLEGEERSRREKELKEERDYEVLEEIPFWNDGGDFSRKSRNRLYYYRRGDLKATAITNESTSVYGTCLSLDHERAIFLQTDYEDKMPLTAQMMQLSLASLSVEEISPIKDFAYNDLYYLDDGIVFVGSDGERYGLNQDSDIYFFNPDSKELRKLVPDDFDLSLWNSVGSDVRQGGGRSMKVDGGDFYFVTTEGVSSHLNRINKEGDFERISTDQGSIEHFDVIDGQIYFAAFRGLNLAEIYTLTSDGEELCLTDFNPSFAEYKLGTLESFVYRYGEDELEAFVILPPDYDASKRYPSILTIHGGPKTVYGTIYFHEMHFLASQGYILYYTNPRGSDGQGRDWADIRGRYGSVEYEQLMRLTDEVLERYPTVDPDRLAVTGGSYGGFMTNWIIGQTDRFKAAVTQRSISNMISMFGISDIGYYFINDQSAGDPWTDAEDLWRQSPLKYADKIQTPTLIIHSDQDYRCPLAEGIQFFNALKYHGVESRMVIFKGESHGLSRGGKPKHRVRRLREMLEWFDKYLEIS